MGDQPIGPDHPDYFDPEADVDTAKQIAAEQAQQEQREKAEQQAVEEAAATGAPLPDPNSEPGEAPDTEHVEVPCAGCATVYGFDIAPNTATFKFECQSCGTKSEWKRI